MESSQVHSVGWSDRSANSRSFAAGFLWQTSDLYFLLNRNLVFSLQASCVPAAAASMNSSWLAEWPTTLTQLQELVSCLYFLLNRDLVFSLQASRAAASMNSWIAEWPTTLTQLQELVSRLYFLLNRDLVFLIQTSCIALTAAVIISWFAE